MNKIPNIVLALFSGLLMAASWFPPFTFLIFIAWVPLLMVEQRFSQIEMKRRILKLTGLSYLTFFIWNLLTTWWIVYASVGGACLAIIANALLMCAVFMIWHNAKLRIKQGWMTWALIPVWMAWEYGHSLWDLTWPWLTLGNIFAFEPDWVQWYEYTGTSGGGTWILLVNLLGFKLTERIRKQEARSRALTTLLGVLILPILISLVIKNFSGPNTASSPKAQEIVIVQPNLDPYDEKFDIGPDVQLQNLLAQIKGKINGNTDYLVLPETYLTEFIYENYIEDSFSVRFLRDSILAKFPNLTIVTGASTAKLFLPGEKLSATARKNGNKEYYDSFNTGLQFESGKPVKIYHKSKLVPGVEMMPFPALLRPLEELAIDMGGTTGSLGKQKERTVFFNSKNIGIAPVICYESVYSGYVAEYVRNGAQLIFVITNDGWWDNTPGHKQHLNYARLRAIETRCSIARSANTGISGFIDPLGQISQPTKYWESAVISGQLIPNTTQTFFVRFGDLISGISVSLALGIILFSQYLRFSRKKVA